MLARDILLDKRKAEVLTCRSVLSQETVFCKVKLLFRGRASRFLEIGRTKPLLDLIHVCAGADNVGRHLRDKGLKVFSYDVCGLSKRSSNELERVHFVVWHSVVVSPNAQV